MLIAEDNIRQAIKKLLDFVKDFSDDSADKHEVIIISSNYHRLQRESRTGLINVKDSIQQRNSLLFQMLEFIDDLIDRLSLLKEVA